MSKTQLSTNRLPFSHRAAILVQVTTITTIIFFTFAVQATQVKNEKTAPQNSPTGVVADTPEIQRLKKLVAFEVAEEAKKEVTTWAKWIIAPIALALASLGVKTYFDVQTSIKKTLEKFREDSDTARNKAIDAFNDKAEQALENINDKTRQASEAIDQHTNKVKNLAEEHLGIIGFLSASAARKTKRNLRRMIYDAQNGRALPGKLVRSEGDDLSEDKDINELYNLVGIAYKFFLEVFDCDISQGSDLIATVHYEKSYSNSYWNGDQLVLGDGDGEFFQTFILLDFIVHEYSKKLMEFLYQDEPGALIIHLADVFAVLAVQWNNNQTVEDADWVIGKGSLGSSISGRGLRDMREPGTAYDDRVLGKDPQPMHFKNKYQGEADQGGIHINSGILNRAFYMVAHKMGGYAWEKAGKIWYESMVKIQKDNSSPSFLEFAQETYKAAEIQHGKGSSEQQIVSDGWRSVGLVIPLTLG